jgi:hypothetical protein
MKAQEFSGEFPLNSRAMNFRKQSFASYKAMKITKGGGQLPAVLRLNIGVAEN